MEDNRGLRFTVVMVGCKIGDGWVTWREQELSDWDLAPTLYYRCRTTCTFVRSFASLPGSHADVSDPPVDQNRKTCLIRGQQVFGIASEVEAAQRRTCYATSMTMRICQIQQISESLTSYPVTSPNPISPSPCHGRRTPLSSHSSLPTANAIHPPTPPSLPGRDSRAGQVREPGRKSTKAVKRRHQPQLVLHIIIACVVLYGCCLARRPWIMCVCFFLFFSPTLVPFPVPVELSSL